MAIRIVLANRKGGVGKTTTAVNLSANLASLGYKVLAIDFDPQSNLTISFGVNILSLQKSLANVFDNNCSIEDSVLNCLPNLDIVPSTPELEKAIESGYLANHLRKNEIIKFKLRDVESAYDFIIMDTPPTKSILTMNSLATADYVIIPVMLEHFSIVGLKQMHDVIMEVRAQWLNASISLLGVLGTFYQETKNCKEHIAIINSSMFKEYLFTSRIRRNVTLSESVSRGTPIIHFNKQCHGYEDYHAFTREFLGRLEEKRP
jgi:chromosome partitioning protein